MTLLKKNFTLLHVRVTALIAFILFGTEILGQISVLVTGCRLMEIGQLLYTKIRNTQGNKSMNMELMHAR